MRGRTITAAVALLVVALSVTAGVALGGTKATTIKYRLWDSNQLPAYQKCVAAFEKENPEINVDIQALGWDDYWTGITTGFVSGTAPDVFTDHLAKYPEFAKNRQILAIDDLVKRDNVPTNIYFPGLADLWVGADGKRYGLPKDWDTIAVFYNKKMLKAAGITTKQIQTMTWNPKNGGTYEKIIRRLTIDTKGRRGDQKGFNAKHIRVYGLGLENTGGFAGQTQWSHYAASTGFKLTDKPWGTKYHYDDPRLAATLSWWRGLIKKGLMPSLATATSGVGLQTRFGAGQYAMATDGSWNTKGYFGLKGIETGLAPLPVGPKGRRSMFNGLADSISVTTKHKEESWQLVKFLASPACENIVGASAVVFPAVKESLAIAKKAFAGQGINVSPFTVHVEKGTTFTFPITDHGSDVAAIMGPAMDKIIGFKSDTASELKDANAKVNALFG